VRDINHEKIKTDETIASMLQTGYRHLFCYLSLLRCGRQKEGCANGDRLIMLPVERSKVMVLEIENILSEDMDTGVGTVDCLHEHNTPSAADHSFNSLVAGCLDPRISMLLGNYFSRFTNYSISYSELKTLPANLQLEQLQKFAIVTIETDYNWKVFIIMNGKCYIQLYLRPHLNRKAQTAMNGGI
jgi:hypothetical protein